MSIIQSKPNNDNETQKEVIKFKNDLYFLFIFQKMYSIMKL